MNTETKQATPMEGVERLLEAATDSVTDDMVSRLAENASQALDLLDKVNRSGLDRAIPALAQMVNNGDLERLVTLARVYGSAEDALTDDMVGRFAETAGSGLDLLDRVNRSGVDRALPVLTRLVENGDLGRVVDMARMVAAAEDALTDDMVGRLSEMAAEGMNVVDRLNRSGVGRLIDILDNLNSTGALDTLAAKLPKLVDNLELIEGMIGCLGQAAQDVKNQPAPTGGLFSVLRMVSAPENQAFMQFAFALGRRMQENCGTKLK